MPRPYASDPRHVYKREPAGVMRPVLIAFGIALTLGLVSGVVWIVINLLRLHMFG